jgi:signal transduction histidine kinase
MAQRLAPRATATEFKHGVPLFLTQLVTALQTRSLNSILAINESAMRHASDLFSIELTVAQVVHGYGDVCQAITELAMERRAAITADEFHTLNACLDDAIAGAMTEYLRQREKSISDRGTERLGFLAHELRNLLSTAQLAFDALRSGQVGIRGNTGGVLARSLTGLGRLIDSSLAEVRVEAGVQNVQRVRLANFLEEIEVGATMQAKTRGVSLGIAAVDRGVEVMADPQLLAAAVSNLIHNAMKFTHPNGKIAVGAQVRDDRVLIEVEDECGGLPPGAIEHMFRPFEQHGADRTGLGLGLSISRRCVEAIGGTLRVRDLPGKGCAFTIELTRLGA